MNKIAIILIVSLLMALPVSRSRGQETSEDSGHQRNGRCVLKTEVGELQFSVVQLPAEGAGGTRATDARYFCKEVPNTGKTYLSVDLINRDLRTMPIRVRVVEETSENEIRREARTLLDVPAQFYSSGVVSTATDFDKPGHYALLLAIEDQAGRVIRIPLEVGIGAERPPLVVLVTAFFPYILVVALVAFAIYVNIVAKREKSAGKK